MLVRLQLIYMYLAQMMKEDEALQFVDDKKSMQPDPLKLLKKNQVFCNQSADLHRILKSKYNVNKRKKGLHMHANIATF